MVFCERLGGVRVIAVSFFKFLLQQITCVRNTQQIAEQYDTSAGKSSEYISKTVAIAMSLEPSQK